MRALQFRTVGAFGWNFALNATGFINRVKEISGEIVKRLPGSGLTVLLWLCRKRTNNAASNPAVAAASEAVLNTRLL